MVGREGATGVVLSLGVSIGGRHSSVVVPRSELGKGVQELIGDRLSRVGWNVVVPSLVLMFAASKEGEVRDDSPPQ